MLSLIITFVNTDVGKVALPTIWIKILSDCSCLNDIVIVMYFIYIFMFGFIHSDLLEEMKVAFKSFVL